MKRLLLASLVAFVATPAFAVSTCADFNALDGNTKLSTVASLMETEPGLFQPDSRANTVTQQIEAICTSDPNKSLAEAAREQTGTNLRDSN